MSNPIHKRGRYSVAIKKQVIKEALSGEKTLAQIASDFGMSPETVKDWKKQAWQAIEESLTRKGLRSELERKQKEIDTLQRLLGQREFELDWLSKKSQRAGAVEQRHQLVDVHAHTLSRKRQCELLGVARSSSYYKPVTPTAAEQEAEANLARALQALQIPSKNGLRCIVRHDIR